ncbi:MAG: hypothetical protein K2Y21_01265 [Phycisphaerales bacterium]|nr:hypothetical protein [Phycisphaerales bacterium]
MLPHAAATLAYTPFIDPISTIWPAAYSSPWFVNVYCLALISVLTAVAYKAPRIPDLSGPWSRALRLFARHVAILSIQIFFGVLGLGLATHILVLYIVPHIAPM